MIIHLLSEKLNGFKSINKSFSKINIESHDYMLVSMVILAILSILIGYLFSDIFIGLGTPIWSNSIYISPSHENWINYSFLPYYIKDLPLFFAIISTTFIWFFFNIDEMHIYNWLNEYINYIKSCFNPILFKRLSDIGYMLFFLIIYTILYLYTYIKSSIY